MSHYKSNLRDIEFNLFEVLGRDEVLGTGPFGEIDGDTARTILSEVERMSREDLAASYEDSDLNPPVFDPETHSAPLPESFKKSYRAWMDAEYWRLQIKESIGGYFLFEADDLDAAIELAAKVPAARLGGAVEVRPIVEW